MIKSAAGAVTPRARYFVTDRALLGDARVAVSITPGTANSYVLSYKTGGKDKRFTLPAGTTVAGRASTCDLVLGDGSVSRMHARFTVDRDRCTLNDLVSSNGTFVNDQPVQTATLKDGDRVLLGSFPLTLNCEVGGGVVLTDEETFTSREVYLTPGDGGTASVLTDPQRPLRLLYEIGRTLAGPQPLDEVLAHVVDLAFESTKAERTLLLLYDAATDALVPRVVRYRRSTPASTTLSRTIVNRVLRERVSMLAVDAQADPRWDTTQSIISLETKSFMCAPLCHDSEVIGVLYVDNRARSRFTEADLELFTAFSHYAAVAIAQARLTARVQEEIRRRERLERYHSPAVVDRILAHDTGADSEFIAQERELTVLFADLVNFTAMAEGMAPQTVVSILNGVFARMADAIFTHDGTLDKFIGDSVLAVFGAPLDLPNHALSAVRAAESMRQGLAALQRERPDPVLQMRIAIHTGVAMVGDIGSPTRRDFTVMGDVVNTAARIEQTVAGAGPIVVSRATYDRLEGKVRVRPLGAHQFRGRTSQVELFEVLAEA
jgi:adenylate cyclase